jgi:hypothetical protein
MNTPDDLPEDKVTGAYRPASEAQAGRPAPSTRAAILAEARAANLRRTPAANESRYAWRAVAGLAVLGVAVLLWRQADRHVSPDLTVASADRGDTAVEAPAMPQVGADAPVVAAERTARVAVPERENTHEEKSAATDLASVAAPAAQSFERTRADASPASAAGALRQDAGVDRGLLQREFPEIWRGDRVATIVWVVMDAGGKVVRKGELTDANTLASVASESPGTWTLVQVKTASGSSLQLAVRKVD